MFSRTNQEIKKFAEKQMGTKDVRIDTRLNKAIWAQVICALLHPDSTLTFSLLRVSGAFPSACASASPG